MRQAGTLDKVTKSVGEIVITPDMIEAGCKKLVFDSALVRSEVVFDILFAALNAGGYKLSEEVFVGRIL